MKRRITFSIALSLCIGIVGLMISDPSVKAAASRSYIADSGMITLGPNQIMRVTVANTSSQRSLTVAFTDQFTSAACSGGVCTHTVTSQTTTDPVTLLPRQAASHDIMPASGASAVRAIVVGNGSNMLVNGLIIDTTTGQSTVMSFHRYYGDCDAC